MSDEKKNAKKEKFNFLSIYIIGFIISVFFEFYWISYYPYDYFMLFGIGIILCIFGYLSIDEILHMVKNSQQKRNDQDELMLKACKAIYLATKKNALNSSIAPMVQENLSERNDLEVETPSKNIAFSNDSIDIPVPEIIIPETDTEPVSEPDVSESDISEPDVSEPDISEPDISEPETSTDFNEHSDSEIPADREALVSEDTPVPTETSDISELMNEITQTIDEIKPEDILSATEEKDDNAPLTPDEIADIFANL